MKFCRNHDTKATSPDFDQILSQTCAHSFFRSNWDTFYAFLRFKGTKVHKSQFTHVCAPFHMLIMRVFGHESFLKIAEKFYSCLTSVLSSKYPFVRFGIYFIGLNFSKLVIFYIGLLGYFELFQLR